MKLYEEEFYKTVWQSMGLLYGAEELKRCDVELKSLHHLVLDPGPWTLDLGPWTLDLNVTVVTVELKADSTVEILREDLGSGTKIK